jgi:hypothetical protein
MNRLAALTGLLVAASAVGFASRDAAAQSVGFHPSTIELQDALRGQRYELAVELINQADEERLFEIASAGEVAEWLTFADPEDAEAEVSSITVPANSEVRLDLFVEIPETAANGHHSGMNTYDGYTPEAARERSGLVIGFQQPIEINVTGDQVLDLQAGDVFASNVEVGQPLRVQVQLNNRGNVDARADFQAAIWPAADDGTGDAAAEVETQLERVPAGKSSTAVTEWDTAGRTPGEYRAEYTIALEGDRIAAGEFMFELLPYGSAARAGVIQSLTVVEPIEAGAMGRADAVFKNEGAIDSLARFEGQLFQDGVPIAEAESPDSLLVRPNEEVLLSAFFPIPEEASGEFEVRGRVYFEGAQTDEASAPFTIGGGGGLPSTVMMGGAAALAVGMVTLGGAWALRRRS